MDGVPDSWRDLIHTGDKLNVEIDHDNEIDPFTVSIKAPNGLTLGYVPGIYAQAIHALLKRSITVTLTVNQINPNFTPQWWVRVGLSANIESLDETDRESSYLQTLIFRETA